MSAAGVLRHHRVALAGRVVNEMTSEPISCAVVMLAQVPAIFGRTLELASLRHRNVWASMAERPDRTRSRADGTFHFVDLPAGEYTLRASVPGLGARYGIVEQSATLEQDQRETKYPFVNLAVPPTTIKGKVTGPSRKASVVMADVRLKGSGERAFTDAQGSYALSCIEPGTRTVLVYAQGFRAVTVQVKLTGPGDVQTVNVALVREPG